ncbi:MAG: hypothetical protein FWG10_12800 [Eubacteriaceae bacterium]|nr:hypothetical protein [Eubacteriaceae bacterium]
MAKKQIIDQGAELEILASADAESQDAASLGSAFTPKPKARAEARSQRVNLVVKPSVYKKAKEKCGALGVSFNEFFNQFLEDWVGK